MRPWLSSSARISVFAATVLAFAACGGHNGALPSTRSLTEPIRPGIASKAAKAQPAPTAALTDYITPTANSGQNGGTSGADGQRSWTEED